MVCCIKWHESQNLVSNHSGCSITLVALASMPITATHAYAGGNVKGDTKNHVHNNEGDTDIDQDRIGNEIMGSCNTTTGGGGTLPHVTPRR
jgi:hypothetical protein